MHKLKPMPAQAGIGLRAPHYQQVVDLRPQVGWLEVHAENYFGAGGLPHHYLSKIRSDYPLSFHGVGLSLGSANSLNTDHLKRLKQLIDQYQPALVSEHLSWGALDGVYVNDLLPLPLTEQSLLLMVSHVQQMQDYLQRQILIENPSSYLHYANSEMSEPEFLRRLCSESGCSLLLDINNVYVSASNLGFDAREYLQNITADTIAEIHLAGHAVNQVGDVEILIDDHGSSICDPVWDLFVFSCELFGPKPTLIEWDSNIPALECLVAEARKADRLLKQNHARVA